MKKQMIVTFALLLLIPTIISAITLEEYVANLDTSYYDGTINVTLFDDNLIDTDSNSQNDTLTFNLTTDYATSATFTAQIFFTDDYVPTLSSTKSISSSVPSFNLNISTFYLKETQYTYFVRIYNQIGQIVYESKKLNTSLLGNYETGTNITQITDESINDDYIRINLTLDVTRNETVNISVNLGFNDTTISVVKEHSLTTPNQFVSIDFDNETIKSTHYNGIYSVESIQIGNKIFNPDYNTSSYDYEDFAKTSFIDEIISYQIDNNSNNLSDALRFNFSLDIKSGNDYTIEAGVYDEEDNYIATIAKNTTLGAGNTIVTLEISGEDMYSTYYSGELVVSYAKLSMGNNTKDFVYNYHTTNMTYYTDFERPPLSDLIIDMSINFSDSTNITDITINMTNKGEVPAFNIFVDIFDNNTYENQSSVSYLDVDESQIFNYGATNTTNHTLFTAIADFSNYVDESNESNNIVQVAPEEEEDTAPPIILNLRNTSTTNQSTFIEWTCDENCNYSITIGEQGAGPVCDFSNNTMAMSHNPYCVGLSASTLYEVQLTVWDESGNSATNNSFQFTTASSPSEAPASVSITFISPTIDTNVTQNEFFSVMVNVTCLDANCGEINVSLDPQTENNVSSYNGVLTTTGTAHSEGYTISDVSSQNCGQSTCDSSDSWEAGFDNIDPANTQVDWYFNVSTLGISGSDIIELNINGGGCWHGGNARACEGDDPPEFSTDGNLDIGIYNWDTAVYDSVGTAYTISGSTGDAYQEYSKNKSSGFSDGHVSSEGIIKIRYNITGTTLGASYDVIGVYDYSFITVTYDSASSKNGLISTTIGATPFYTNESNPKTISLNQGQSQTVTFWVNATGSAGIPHTFFAYANLTSNLSIGNETGQIQIQIIEAYNNPPSYSENSTNSTVAGEDVLFSVRWIDSNDLSSYLFTWHNGENFTLINTSSNQESGSQSYSGQEAGTADYSEYTCTTYWGADCSAWASGCSSESDNTIDACTNCAGGSSDEHVNEIYVNGTVFVQNDAVKITCEYDPFTSGTEEYIWVRYPNQTWIKLYSGVGPDGNPHNVSVTFTDTSNTGEYVARCIVDYDGTGTTQCESGSWFDHDDTIFNVTTPGTDIDANKTSNPYNDVSLFAYEKINNITVSVYVSYYNTSGSIDNGNSNATLWLEVYNGSNWLDEGDFLVTGTGNFSVTITTESILSAWDVEANRDVRVSARLIDYNETTGNFDTINWTGIWLEVQSEQYWLNDSVVAFTDGMCSTPKTDCWSNLSKTITSTVGATIEWYISANDTYGSSNQTNIFSFVTSGEGADNPSTITQVSPANDTSFFVEKINLTFGANVNDDNILTNVSIYINGTINQTNSSGVNGIYNFTIEFSYGYYEWYIEAWDNASQQTVSATRVFTVGGSDITTPTYSQNSTNSTTAGTDIEHRLRWQDDASLSGYIFKFCNGYWDGSNCSTLVNTTLNYNYVLEDGMFDEDDTRDGTFPTIGVDFIDGTGEIGFYKFDISSIPVNAIIINATLILNVSVGSDNNIDVWYSDNQTWKEEEIDGLCGNSVYCSDLNNMLTTYLRSIAGSGSVETMYIDSLQEAVQNEITNGNSNVTFALNNTDSDAAGYYNFGTKERVNSNERPKLNIVYTTGNWTIGGWELFPNGGLNDWSNVTKSIISEENKTFAWCIIANDTSGNINSTSCDNPFVYVSTAQPGSDPPVISNLRNTSTTNQSTFVEWDCNESCNYTINMYGGGGTPPVCSISNNILALSHNPFCGELKNSTNYDVSLTVWDSSGNSATNNTFNFTTAANLPTGPSPQLSISWVYPTGNLNVTQNEFFKTEFNVSCTNADCGEINVSLDPKEEVKFTPSTETRCRGRVCTMMLYSGIRFVYEDNRWKKVEEAKSLKDAWEVIIHEDPLYPVEVIDYNYSSITLDLSVSGKKLNKAIDLKVYSKFNESQKPRGKTGKEENKDKKIMLNNINERYRTIIDLSDTSESILGQEIKWGDNSTTIQLQDADTENLEDTYIDSANSSGNFGTLGVVRMTNLGRGIFIKFNISQLPANAEIESAKLDLYRTFSSTGNNVYIYNVTNATWDEEIVTWDNRAEILNNVHIASISGGASSAGWYPFAITTYTEGIYKQGLDILSLYMNYTGSSYNAYSKEEGDATKRPYLNITYTEGTSTKSGLIPTTSGETPFYTNSTANPANISLNQGEHSVVTFWVNATGDVNTTHEFFSFVNKTSDMSINNITSKINISIQS